MQKVLLNPLLASKKVLQNPLVKGSSEPHVGFYRTFLIESPLFRLLLQNFPYRPRRSYYERILERAGPII